MSDIILHHYQSSPFSEKIRLILGYKKLAWKSVIIPVIMPKPNVIALTGGYRRTPIMQIGADIYCDTALIADVLERIAPTPTLYPKGTEGLARTLAQWADSTLFWTMITHRFQPAGVQSALAGLTPEQVQAFVADRAAFRSNVPRMPLPEATGSLKEYFRRLESMFDSGNAYLLGNEPCLADFSVYHSVWFLLAAPVVADVLDVAPRLKEWAARMAAIGHHNVEKSSAEEALEAARASTAASTEGAPFIDYHGVALGDRVAVMPSDYGMDPVEGELVLSADNEFAVQRTDPMAGTVIVHFPRIGFQLKKA
jgi:glutathione S-transferase